MRLLAIVVLTTCGMFLGSLQAQDEPSPAGNTKSKAASAAKGNWTNALSESGDTKLTDGEIRRLIQDQQQSKHEPAQASAGADAKPSASATPSASPARAVPSMPLVAPAPPVPVGQPTAAQVANLKVGTSEKDMLAALGNPAGCVTIPDDEHLRKTCQYFSKGSLVGTVRLDNGSVVQVEAAH